MGGATVLMSVQVSEGVMYIPLVPLSDMEVSVMVRTVLFVVGLWGGVGRQLEHRVTLF